MLAARTFSRWTGLEVAYAAPRPNAGARSHRSRVRDGRRSSRWSAGIVPLQPAPTIAIGRWGPVMGKAAPLGPDTSFRARVLADRSASRSGKSYAASGPGRACTVYRTRV